LAGIQETFTSKVAFRYDSTAHRGLVAWRESHDSSHFLRVVRFSYDPVSQTLATDDPLDVLVSRPTTTNGVVTEAEYPMVNDTWVDYAADPPTELISFTRNNYVDGGWYFSLEMLDLGRCQSECTVSDTDVIRATTSEDRQTCINDPQYDPALPELSPECFAPIADQVSFSPDGKTLFVGVQFNSWFGILRVPVVVDENGRWNASDPALTRFVVVSEARCAAGGAPPLNAKATVIDGKEVLAGSACVGVQPRKLHD
jgi:hypothetical protein